MKPPPTLDQGGATLKKNFCEWVDATDRLAAQGGVPTQNGQAPSNKMVLWRSPGQPVDMENMFFSNAGLGSSAFLLCSGPSLQKMNLAPLRERGIVTMAVNNCWSVFRPDLWVSVDPPGSFCDLGWKDPGIMKFVSMPHRMSKLRVKKDGAFLDSQFCPADMPNCWYFSRNADFHPEHFLTEPSVNWGHHDKKKDLLGVPGSRSVMLAGLKLLYYLGFRKVYLLGADFKMIEGTQNYAFPQDRTQGAVNGNNKTYGILNERFRAMRPHFLEKRFRVINCTPDSGLDAFEKLPYEDALEQVSQKAEMDTVGWYTNLAKNRSEKPKEARDPRAPAGPAPMEGADKRQMFAAGLQDLMDKMGVFHE